MESGVLFVISIALVLLALLTTLLGYLLFSGLLEKIEVKAGKPPFKNITVAYKFARGPYKNAGRLFTEVHSLVPSLRTIGIYYDDPDQVDSPKLRYLVGAILSDGDDISDKATFDLLKEHGYKFVSFPEVDNVLYATFPFKGSMSVIIGVSKAYPSLREYVSERKLCAHPAIEVYDGKLIYFVLPLSKQDEFYVPESLDETDEPSEPITPPEANPGSGDVCSSLLAAPVELPETTAEQIEETISQNSEIPEALREISSANATNGDNDSDKSTTSSFEELQLDAES